MGDFKEASLKAKAARKGLIEQRPLKKAGKSNKPRPFALEYRLIPGHPIHAVYKHATTQWRKWKTYASEEEAARALENLRRKNSALYEFRLAGGKTD